MRGGLYSRAFKNKFFERPWVDKILFLKNVDFIIDVAYDHQFLNDLGFCMQIFALDEGKLIKAKEAQKRKSYLCPECGSFVFVRKGFHKQAHYYHVSPSKRCRQSQKGLQHLQVQWTLLHTLPLGEAKLEFSFPSIHRIADLFWEKEGIVFEVQCSPISEEEVKARSRDYRSLGLKIVWILHDQRFNKNKLSVAEHWLRSALPCYYTNITAEGSGICYDQFEIVEEFYRLFRGPPLPVIFRYSGERTKGCPFTREKWELSFQGDLIDQWQFANSFTKENMMHLEKTHKDFFYKYKKLNSFPASLLSLIARKILSRLFLDKLKIELLSSRQVGFFKKRWPSIQRGYERLLDMCIRSLSDS